MTATGRDRILLSFGGFELTPAAADAIVERAAGVTLYRHLNVDTPSQVRALTDTLQAAATRSGLPPLLIGADHETGQLHAMGAGSTPFAGAMAVGAAGDPGLAERVGRAIGIELRAMGVNVCYAPVCDLATNPRNPVVGIRSFGDDPAAVGALAAATVRGIQGAGVAATIKHLPGHGEPAADSHLGLPVIERSRDELAARELIPFRAAIAADVRLAMAGHLAVPAWTGRPDVPATLAPEILLDLLRDELRFSGLAVSDALDMGAVSGGGDGADVAAALRAGTDLLLCGPDPEAQARVEGTLQMAIRRLAAGDIAASSARLGTLHDWLATFEQPPIDVVASASHRALAEELAGRSITLIRDRDGLVPLRLARDARVVVIEPKPRDLTPADTTSLLSPGGLADAIRATGRSVVGRVVDAVVSSATIAGLRLDAAAADLVVLGTVDALRERSIATLAEALVATGTPVIGVALRGPWDAVACGAVGTFLATYGIQPPSLAALAAGLSGDRAITGRLPVVLAD